MENTVLYLVQQLEQRGIAYLHINDQATFGIPAIPEGLLPKICAAFNGSITLCGGYEAARAAEALNLANPDLPALPENSWSLNKPDRDTFYGDLEKRYTTDPYYEPTS